MAAAFVAKQNRASAIAGDAEVSATETPSVGAIMDGMPRRSFELLSQIHAGKPLRKSEDGAPGASGSETFARAGLLNEIRKPKELKPVSAGTTEGTAQQTMARAGLLHELHTKRQAVPAAAEGGGEAADLVASTVKEGWLHKRAGNGIWQKRYFVLTTEALSYNTRPQAAAKESSKAHMPIEELKDMHPTGATGEFSFHHQDRLVRLRADSAAEAVRHSESNRTDP
jgi:hypothetical protein